MSHQFVARSGLIYKEKSKDIIMNLCMNRTIESGVETLRARVVYNKGAVSFVRISTYLILEIINLFILEV